MIHRPTKTLRVVDCLADIQHAIVWTNIYLSELSGQGSRVNDFGMHGTSDSNPMHQDCRRIRRPGVGRDPAWAPQYWIPACAGRTVQKS